MIRLGLAGAPARLRTLLCIGAHCDDIEIGCGGTLLRLTREFPDLAVWWIVLSSNARRAAEARCGAERLLARAGERHVVIKEFRNGYFPYVGAEIKDYFEELKRRVSPDLILAHCRDELHQDHRLVGELTWNTFRDHLVWEYEIPKYDGGLGSPNLFVPLAEAEYRGKIDVLGECFASQREKSWFNDETFLGLMRLRGVECNAPSGYAEAFYCRKAVV